MIRLLVLIALLVYGAWAGADFYLYTQVVSEVRQAVRADGLGDPGKRDDALDDLHRRGGNALQVLLQMVRDPKLDLVERQMAQRALAHFSDDVVKADLKTSAAHGEALELDLSYQGDDFGVDHLIDATRGRDPAVRSGAAAELGERGKDAAGAGVDRLIELAREDRHYPVRVAAVEALAALGSAHAAKAARPLAEIAEEDAERLGKAATRALAKVGGSRGAIEKLLDQHPVEAAGALEALGDPAARAALAKRLSAADPAVAFASARALASLGDGAGVEKLKARLGDGDPDTRARAAAACRGLESPVLVAALIQAAGDPEPRVRREVAAALGACEGPQVPGALKAMLLDADPGVRLATTRAIGARRDPQLASTLRDLVTDKDSSVAAAAIEASVAMGDINIVPDLRDILGDRELRSLYVRKAAWLGLKTLTGKAPAISDEEASVFSRRRVGAR